MKYKLLVLDVDGTLLNSERQISKHTVSTLRKVQHMGIHVALASGRPTYGIMPLVAELDLAVYDGYIISYNGSQVISARTNEIIFDRSIDPQMVPYLEKKAGKLGMTMAYYDGNEVVSTDISNQHVIDEAQMNGMQLRQVKNISDGMESWPAEIILVHDDEQVISGFEDHMQSHLSGVMDTIHSNPYYLEVVGYQVGKGYAMSALVQKLGIGMDEVLAIGDGEADVNMLQMAGTGVAMGNATESVRRCADFTTLPNIVASINSPVNGATDIATNTSIVLSFDYDIEWTGSTEQLSKITVNDGAANIDYTAGSANYNSTTKMLTLNLTSPLAYSNLYTVTIDDLMRSSTKQIVRDSLAHDNSAEFSFTTGAHTQGSATIAAGPNAIVDGFYVMNPTFKIGFVNQLPANKTSLENAITVTDYTAPGKCNIYTRAECILSSLHCNGQRRISDHILMERGHKGSCRNR